ncbi:hypothetical protein P154DRAFT_412945, partial [Amniculicola lignicola CBS 123094]
GDECCSLSLPFSISVDDFYFLNPQVDRDCSNLWLETSHCVRPVGKIPTYPAYLMSTPGTIFPKPTPELISRSYPPVVTPSLSVTVTGTVSGCLFYMSASKESIGSVVDLSVSNPCSAWVIWADVTVEDLFMWNPGLSKGNCVLQAGKSYCILKCR